MSAISAEVLEEQQIEPSIRMRDFLGASALRLLGRHIDQTKPHLVDARLGEEQTWSYVVPCPEFNTSFNVSHLNREADDGNGIVLFLPGFSASSDCMQGRNMAYDLAIKFKDRQIITVDNEGAGRTKTKLAQLPKLNPHSMARARARVLEGIFGEDTPSMIVVGQSMGGLIGAHLAEIVGYDSIESLHLHATPDKAGGFLSYVGRLALGEAKSIAKVRSDKELARSVSHLVQAAPRSMRQAFTMLAQGYHVTQATIPEELLASLEGRISMVTGDSDPLTGEIAQRIGETHCGITSTLNGGHASLLRTKELAEQVASHHQMIKSQV